MSITTVSKLDIVPEKTEIFLDMIREGASFTRSFEGCESFEFYTEAQASNTVFFIETWSSQELQQAYVDARTEDGSMERVGAMMAGAPNMSVLLNAE